MRILIAAAALCLLVLPGCLSPEDTVKVQVPREVRKVLPDVPAEVPLSKMPAIREDYQAVIEAEAQKKADEATATQRATASVVKKVQRTYGTQIANLQAQAEAEIEAVETDATERLIALQAASASLERDSRAAIVRIERASAAAQAKADQIRSLVSGGLDAVMPYAAGIPGVGLLLPALAGVLGWRVLPRAKESEQSAEIDRLKAERIALVEQHKRDLEATWDQAASETRRNVREGSVVAAIAEKVVAS